MANESAIDLFFTPKNESFPYHEVYAPLSIQEKQIRLMTLMPGTGDEPVHCEVRPYSLATLLKYEALSYCAGNPADCVSILLNGSPFNVFRSLYSALQHLRRSSGNRLIWIDQICINQTDLQERSIQVSMMMKDIYQAATTTVAWLGEPMIGNDAAFDLWDHFCAVTKDRVLEILRRYKKEQQRPDQVVNKPEHIIELMDEADLQPRWWKQWLSIAGGLLGDLAAEPSLIDALEWIDVSSREKSQKTSWEALKSLGLHRWYRRCWIVQEVAASPCLILKSGTRLIEWDDLVLFKGCLHILWCHARANGRETSEALYDTLMSLCTVDYLDDIRTDYVCAQTTLYRLLSSTHDFSASDHRDKVYALLGLCGNRVDEYCISIDYSLSTTLTNVFIMAVKALALVDQILPFDLLGSEEHCSDMPSWVPDFFKLRRVIVWQVSVSEMGQAGGMAFAHPVFLENDMVMEFSGIEVTSLHEVLTPRYDFDVSSAADEVLKSWISTVLAYLSECSDTKSHVIQDFLEVIFLPGQYLQELTDSLEEQLDTAGTLFNFMKAHFHRYFRANLPCRFFLLQDGMMGLVPGHAELGDLIFVPCGADTPIVVRKTETSQRFKFVGICYVQGIMRGELFQGDADDGFKTTRMQLV